MTKPHTGSRAVLPPAVSAFAAHAAARREA
jgi:hypothetical protein